MKLLCDHDFEIIDKMLLPSAFEQVTESGGSLKIKETRVDIFAKKLVIVLKCSSCNRIDTIVETNP